MSRPSRIVTTLVCAGFFVLPQAASADHHLIKVREVGAGADATGTGDFVELQMYSAGQHLVGNKVRIRFWSASGIEAPPYTLTSNVANGGNQRTILVASGSGDFSSVPMSLEPAGGAACFTSLVLSGFNDCVSWGSFSSAVTLPSPAGQPAAAMASGQSLTRSIAAGCATLLEASDDTNSSSANFAAGPPTPRNNATAPTETTCTNPGPGPGPGPGPSGNQDNDPPQTTIRKRPPNVITDRTPTFRFRSDEAGSKFECKLDGKAYRPCSSPFTTKKLSFRSHTLRVRARDREGNRDSTPAKDTFKVVRP